MLHKNESQGYESDTTLIDRVMMNVERLQQNHQLTTQMMICYTTYLPIIIDLFDIETNK